MPGVWKKTLNYLGLVEDEELDEFESGEPPVQEPVRVGGRLARELGDRFRGGIPVIMNLQSTEDQTARRLVDFASGLVFGLGGKIETVANRVYLLTPANVEVSAEERERLREGGFYNQF